MQGDTAGVRTGMADFSGTVVELSFYSCGLGMGQTGNPDFGAGRSQKWRDAG
jgi:hypothetical protein